MIRRELLASSRLLLQRAAGPASPNSFVSYGVEQRTVLVFARKFANNAGDKDPDNRGMLSKLVSSVRRGARGDGAGRASESKADSDNNALVPSIPENKYRKVHVVELTRKPLFPGIYHPVVIIKNEKLIREMMETKRQGGQAYVGAFLKRPEPGDAAGGKEAAAAEGGAAVGSDAAAGTRAEVVTTAAAVGSEAGASDPADHLYEVGTFAQVHTIMPMQGDGDRGNPDSAQLLLLGYRRLKRTQTVGTDPLRVAVQHLKDLPYENDDIMKATSMEIVNTIKDLVNMNPLYEGQFRTLMSLSGAIDLTDASRLVDIAAALVSADDVVLQKILEELEVPKRQTLVLELLKKEVELCKIQADIREQVESKIMKEQRRMLLMEQLKSIKKELGLEKDDKSALMQRFHDKWSPKRDKAPEEVRRVVGDELDKLGGLEPVSPEFNVTRNYLEWLTSLPWGEYSNEIFDIQHGKQVLDEDHYGLEDVKERILEFIAVSRLRGSAQGKILCLVGPPGVGKTSVGRSIARTLNRKYYRFSVGGLYDVAEIKGHRRTYVGAMPGKMVQCLKSTQTSNPLVLIDEIDKLGRGHTGDPASALLELLDPEQNSSFVDHYLDVPIDLSKVLFVCTANVLDTIPGPLLDRMEVIRLAGYAADEKRAIARRYLEPASRLDSGVPEGAVQLTDPAVDALINEYCREAGVRNLKKQLEKVYRKVALKLVEKGAKGPKDDTHQEPDIPAEAQQAHPDGSTPSPTTDPVPADASGASSSITAGTSATASTGDSGAASASSPSDKAEPEAAKYQGEELRIDSGNLKDYIGQPPYTKDRFYEATPPGVVMGLAWTAMGGATLYVEAARVVEGDSKGSLMTTGQLGEVFRESASIAHTFARALLQKVAPGNKFFDNTAIHVHVPAGATPKDGPSAGCTIITALLSLALNKPVKPDLAMTGEVTLTGRVLPIGGVKEKLLAARRSGVTTVVFPEANQRDYDELSADLKQGIEPHFVSSYEQIYQLALKYDEQPTPAVVELAAAAAPQVAPSA